MKKTTSKPEKEKLTHPYACKSAGKRLTKNGRLTKQFLYELRNDISIGNLIETGLGLPCHTESGIFRFQCPRCASFNTSIMKIKNLARCFDCEITFNTIDMVMAVKNIDFLSGTKFLSTFLDPAHPGALQDRKHMNPKIFSTVQEVFAASEFSPAIAEQKVDNRRIRDLEKQVETLKKRLDQLYSFINEEFIKMVSEVKTK